MNNTVPDPTRSILRRVAIGLGGLGGVIPLFYLAYAWIVYLPHQSAIAEDSSLVVLTVLLSIPGFLALRGLRSLLGRKNRATGPFIAAGVLCLLAATQSLVLLAAAVLLLLAGLVAPGYS